MKSHALTLGFEDSLFLSKHSVSPPATCQHVCLVNECILGSSTEKRSFLIVQTEVDKYFAGPWSDAVQTFAMAGFQCPQYKNPTDYFMKIASEPEGRETMVNVQKKRWVSFKQRGAWSKPSTDPNVIDGSPENVEVVPKTSLQRGDLTIMDSPTVCFPA
jgi:hypothetical protein